MGPKKAGSKGLDFEFLNKTLQYELRLSKASLASFYYYYLFILAWLACRLPLHKFNFLLLQSAISSQT
jgi:hypothetical protein